MREAVFFLMTPRFAALSIAWKTPESCAVPFGLFSKSLTVIFIARLLRALKTALRTAPRFAFFAESVFAMSRDST